MKLRLDYRKKIHEDLFWRLYFANQAVKFTLMMRKSMKMQLSIVSVVVVVVDPH